jgi:hypothetical protein
MKPISWKFWKTASRNDQTLNQKARKLPKPKDLPDRVGIHLVTQLKLDPDWVWTLKVVVRPTTERQNFEIRIFDPEEAFLSDVIVTDFNSLEDFPELILFEGYFNKNTGVINIKRTADQAA